MQLIKQFSAVIPLAFKMVLASDGVTAATGLSPTVTLSKNGATFATPAGAVGELGNGWYAVAPNATDSGTLGVILLHASAATANQVNEIYQVVAFDPNDSVRLGLTSLPNLTAGAAGGLPLAKDGSGNVQIRNGTITNSSFAANALTASTFATSFFTTLLTYFAGDGLTMTSILELLVAFVASPKSTYTDNGDGTATITCYKQDGTTVKFSVTYNKTTSARSASAIH